MFKSIIPYSSTKSLVLPLHKFTIQKLVLFFPFFGKLKLLSIAVYLLTCQYFRRMEKRFAPEESRIAFCQLFIVRVKKVCYERKVERELLGSYFHCTLEWFHPYFPTTSFRLMTLWNKTFHPVNSKMQQKIT